MSRKKIFENPNKYDNFFFGFVHSGVTYCFFLLSEKTLPKNVLNYEETIKEYKIFASAICKHVIEHNGVSSAKEITRDMTCMYFVPKGCNGFQVVNVCNHLCHIFIAL